MTTMTRGSRIATITPEHGEFTVYCGRKGTNCPGEEVLPSRFFGGTCSRSFKTEGGAKRAAKRFLEN